MRPVLLTITAFVLIFNCSCSDESTRPPDDNGPDTTSHNFSWQFDTLAYPESFQTGMKDIWGSSENDVYTVGHNDRSAGQIWHWDGVEWQSLVNTGGPIDPYYLRGGSFEDIDGASAEDVWIVGSNYINYPERSGLILHYNGSEWMKKEYGNSSFLSVWVGSADNIWCGSADGKILHFDGTTWQEFDIGFEAQVNGITGFSDQEVYAHATELDKKSPLDSIYNHFIKYDGNTVKIIDTYLYTVNQTDEKFGGYLWADRETHNLYSSGSAIFLWESDGWTVVTDQAKGQIYGSASNNIFTVSSSVYHFSGNTWKRLSSLPKLNSPSAWCTNKFVFITSLLNEGITKSVILRGRQQ